MQPSLKILFPVSPHKNIKKAIDINVLAENVLSANGKIGIKKVEHSHITMSSVFDIFPGYVYHFFPLILGNPYRVLY